jgi:hypothetical protein
MLHHSRAVTSARGAFRPAVTVALAALGVPRVVLHDLDVIDGGDAVNLLLVFGPPLVWIAFAVITRVPRPIRALTWVGGAYGVLLAATHQWLWDRAFEDDPPRLGGNLEGRLSSGVEELVLRTFSVASSLATGLLVGVVCGLVAAGVLRWQARRRGTETERFQTW